MNEKNTLEAILQVLATTVLVDSKTHSAEPEEFRDQIKNLQIFAADHPSAFGDVINIDKWCDANWEDIKENLAGEKREDYIIFSLADITDEFLQPMLYSSMNDICHCDNEFHSEEKALLMQAARLWDLS